MLAIMLWLTLLAWLIGRVLTDRFAWSQWLWWMPTPAIIVLSVLGLLLANRPTRVSGRRKRRIVIWTLFAAAVTMHFALFEHRMLRGTPPAPSADKSLAIAHWNMTLDDYTPVDLLLQRVAELDADVTVLTAPSNNVVRRLTQQATASNGREQVYNGWPLFVFSRVPIERVRLLVASDQRFVTSLQLDTTARLGRAIVLEVADMPSPPRIPRMQMAREVRSLIDQTTAPPPDLVVGDLNIPRGSASIEVMFPGMRSAFDLAGHGYGATFPRRFPLYHIDHVLISETTDLSIARYDTYDEGLSRHRAQKAWITAVQD
jgi:endonuclease/exonuclease/phosphatase family metal-dependent hydrolase